LFFGSFRKNKKKPRVGTQSEPAPTSRGQQTRKRESLQDNQTQTQKIDKFHKFSDESEGQRRISQSLEIDSTNIDKIKLPYSKSRRLTFSKRVPAAALTREEYRLKRGLANK